MFTARRAGRPDPRERRRTLGAVDRVTVVAYAASPSTPPATLVPRFIVKGLRNAGDFEIEQQMAHTNYAVTGIRTVYLPCTPALAFISSRFIREIAQYGGDDRPPRAGAGRRRAAERPHLTATATEPSRRDELRRRRTYDDDYDDIDDDVPRSAATDGYVGDAETLLRRAIDIIATAPTMPLSSSPRIDRDEIIELLEEALHRLPDELRQARWMLKERQEFVAKTRREADELLEAARVQAERMVQRTEVVRAAEQRARQVDGGRRGRLAAPAARDRGLPRPAPRQLRDPPRQAAEDRRTPAVSGCRSACIADDTGGRSRTTTRRKGFFDQDR